MGVRDYARSATLSGEFDKSGYKLIGIHLINGTVQITISKK